MKKKLLSFIFAVCLFVPAMFMLSACVKEEDSETSKPETNKYIVTYIVDGETYSTYETSGNEIISLPNNPTKEGFIFDGWYLDEEFETNFDNAAYENQKTTQNFNVYAKLDAIFRVSDGTIIGLTDIGKTLSTISIPSFATSIYNNAFKNCDNLVSVNFNNCSKLRNIGSEAFKWCDNIVSLDLSNCTKLGTIGDQAFASCTKLESINLPKNLYEINETAFSYTDLNEIIIPLDNCYYTCLDKSGNKNCIIEYETKTLIRGTLNTRLPDSTKHIGDGAFSGCEDLVAITLPAGLITIGTDAFAQCYGLENINLSDCVNLTTIKEGAFFASALTDITLPASLTTLESGAFQSCDNLTSVNFSDNSSLTSINLGAFAFCDKLTTINLTNCSDLIDIVGLSSIQVIIDNSKYTSKDKNGNDNCLIDKSTKTLLRGTSNTAVPNDIEIIGRGAFSGCKTLTSIDLSKCTNLETIWSSAFQNCYNLTDIKFPSSITYIGEWAFQNCFALTSIDLSECTNLTRIMSMVFRSCSSLTTVILPSSLVNYGEYAFDSCNNLTTVIINGEAISDISAFAPVLQYAENVYLADDLIIEDNTYLLNRFTKQETSDKTGYDMYVRNAE